MTEPTIVVATIGALATVTTAIVTAVIGRYRNRRERQLAVDGLTASAAAAAQDIYQDVIADMRTQVAAAGQEAASARDAARTAQQRAAEAEANSWRAEQWAREMQRFLVELRPLIARHVPDADEILARLDRVAAAPASSR